MHATPISAAFFILASGGSAYLLSGLIGLPAGRVPRALSCLVLWEAIQLIAVHLLATAQILGWATRVTVPALAEMEAAILAGVSFWAWWRVRSAPAGLPPQSRVDGPLPIYIWAAAAVLLVSYLTFAADTFTGFPAGSDALIYHLPLAARWLQDGSLAIPASRAWQFSMPGNAEIGMMIVLSSGQQSTTVMASWIPALMTTVATYLLAMWISKGNRIASITACLIVLSIPMIEFQVFSAYVDLLATAGILAAFALILSANGEKPGDNPALSFVSGLACGISLGTKTIYCLHAGVFSVFVACVFWVNRIVAAASHFITSGLIPEDRYRDFDAAIVDVCRLRDSTLAEAIILAITYFGAFLSIRFLSATVSTWHSLVTDFGHRFTLAGYWYALVSLPIYQFLVYRWLWRTFIWCKFLRRVSKLDLQLVPTHADQTGGLGFLGETHRLFPIFIFAYAATASAIASREVLFDNVPIQSYKIPIAALVVVMLLIFMGPLFMFAPILLRTRRKGLQEYSTLGCKLGRLYDQKWVKGNPLGESLLSTPDNTSLANYSRDYELVDRMRVFPFEPRTAVVLALAGLIPMAPLLATVMPMEEIFKLPFKALG